MANVNEQLADIYYGLGDAGSYGGVEQLYERAREHIPSITREQVRKFLNEQVTYQLHKPARRKFKHNQTIVGHRDDQ